ncbi:serine/threonine-protein kinase [Dyella monticola]|uniref:serine/threonine-protein kinase n=1 Tax=Dyella monticola TaxID=1927958 RepID=UPI001314A593|nr:serine/threonine-protein kinase [Dyella monticola]
MAHAALDLDPTERSAFLTVRCGGDAELFNEVQWLIASLEPDDSSFLDSDLAYLFEPGADDVVEVDTPRNYHFIRRLEEGGHGVVYLAERCNGDVRQQIALKLLHLAGRLSETMMAQFRAEGAILARLNHPNIVHLIEAGTLQDGRPFIAMEYVDGLPITDYCSAHSLNARQRAELFVKVCAAVSYAHQHLVLHRDLKPSNILVTAEGEPKLLDFGIARLLDHGDTSAACRTVDAQRLLTPYYASPEQMKGQALTTATDVYSLGAVLYEVMAGRPPFLAKTGETFELAHSVCEKEPEKPSHAQTVVLGGNVNKVISVPGDLDAIVLKTLRKRPEDRYTSVYELGTDLRRFLASRPVAARRGSVIYRSRRFVQRNRWKIATISAFVLLITGFAVVRQVQLQRTQLERDRAEQVVAFINNFFAEADPSKSRGETVTVREALDTSVHGLESKRSLDPEIRATILATIGYAYNGLGLNKKGIATLQAALTYLGNGPASAVDRVNILIAIANAHSTDGNFREAIAYYDKAENALQNVSDKQDLPDQISIGKLQNSVLAADANLDKAIPALRAEIETVRERNEESLLPEAYKSLGLAYQSKGDYQAAFDALTLAVNSSAKSKGFDAPSTLEFRASQAQAQKLLDPAKAIPLFKSIIADHARVIGTSDMSYAVILNDLAVTLGGAGQREASVPIYEQARQVARAVAGPEDRFYLQLTGNEAIALVKLGRKAEAAQLLQGTLPALAAHQQSGIDKLVYAHTLYSLGATQLGVNDANAERYFAQADAVLGHKAPDGYVDVYEEILYQLTNAQVHNKHYGQAEASLQRLETVEAQLPGTAARGKSLHVDLLLGEGKYAQAERLAKDDYETDAALGNCSKAAIFSAQYEQAVKKQSAEHPAPLQPCVNKKVSGV